MYYATRTIFLYNIGALCNVKKSAICDMRSGLLCDMRSALCYMGSTLCDMGVLCNMGVLL